MTASSDVPYLLVNPPLTDPTAPYHSIPYLAGATTANGFTDVECVDANIDALNFLSAPGHVAGLLERASETKERLDSTGCRSRHDELLYRVALTATDLSPDFAARAIDVFKNGELFYHYPTYRQASAALKQWLRLITLDGIPESFDDFEVSVGGVVNLSSYDDLRDDALVDTLTGPFTPYFDGPFNTVLAGRPWRLIGFSVNYLGQLPFALRMARLARNRCPDALIVFGGTEVCDVVRFSSNSVDVWSLFDRADVIVPGEGETALGDLLSAVRDGTSPGDARGVMVRGRRYSRPPIVYENIATLPAPAYDVWTWDSYWAPEPVVLYSPTRGCYWNKCTFCDYGLNLDRPTSPSRERPVERVVSDLASLQHLGRTIYFAVDAMSPRYLRQLCEGIADSDITVRWSAELRLERTFPKRRMAEKLRGAGCVAVSFGYESGSQRILDLIDKGVRIDDVESILASLAEQGVGAQIMGFTGFPTETADEAVRTYSYLDARRDLWSLAQIGNFTLTPGSIVARSHDRFGIESLPLPGNEHIARALPWRDAATGQEHWPGEPERRVPIELQRSVHREFEGRPFVGGTDSAHTLLYFARHGRDLVRPEQDEPAVRIVGLRDFEVPFDNVEEFATAADVVDQYIRLRGRGGAGATSMTAWLRERGRAREGRRRVLLLPSGDLVSLPHDMPENTSARRIAALLTGSLTGTIDSSEK